MKNKKSNQIRPEIQGLEVHGFNNEQIQKINDFCDYIHTMIPQSNWDEAATSIILANRSASLEIHKWAAIGYMHEQHIQLQELLSDELYQIQTVNN